MRFDSLEHFGLSTWRLACVGLAAASGAWIVAEFSFGELLGEAEPAGLLVISGLVFYLVVSTPKRVLERERVAEAREAVYLSAYARACLEVTGSRPRTVMMLRPRERNTARAAGGAARMVLLGTKVGDSLLSASRELASYSAAAALRGLAVLGPDGFESGDEESRGLASSSELNRETRVPMFMTVCFFAPIMTLLFAVFYRSYDAASLSELAALEFVLVDLAYHLSSGGRDKV